MIYIYKHRNKMNGKVYIGQTNNFKKRCVPSRYKNSPRFYNAIQKYGWENFTHEILSEIEDQNEADNQEIALIEYFDSTNPEKGYNILPGGGINTRGMKPFYGKKHSEETKEKMSKSMKGKKKSIYKPPHLHPVYLIDTIDGWDEYYEIIKDICKKYPEWNYDTLKRAAQKGYLFKKRYRIEYAEEVKS